MLGLENFLEIVGELVAVIVLVVRFLVEVCECMLIFLVQIVLVGFYTRVLDGYNVFLGTLVVEGELRLITLVS